MKSTPRNLMAGMNVSRDQKVGRVHRRAKGLPQDGAHAGGQTYDSSKRRETTSNHQTMFIRPRPATTSTVPEVSSVVDARAFHAPDGYERAAMSWVFLCTRERIQPGDPRGSSLRNRLIDFPGTLEAGGAAHSRSPFCLPGTVSST